MKDKTVLSAFIFGVFLLLGLSALGYLPGSAALQFKSYERTVTVKGLSEKVYPADVVIWPIVFSDANHELDDLYQSLNKKTEIIIRFLKAHGINDDEISVPPPAITDKSNDWYGREQKPEFRYAATQKLSVYSTDVDKVRGLISQIRELGKQDIAFSGDYNAQPRYQFTQLNAVKPLMIEQATIKAREVALKFAKDSNSQLGKIKRATQGRFSIQDRDEFNKHLKEVRVVSTVEYYLSD